MLIQVLGPGCARCDEAKDLVERVVRDHGINATVEKIADLKTIMALGVLSTPAIVVDGKVRCTGRVPGTDELLEWLAPSGA